MIIVLLGQKNEFVFFYFSDPVPVWTTRLKIPCKIAKFDCEYGMFLTWLWCNSIATLLSVSDVDLTKLAFFRLSASFLCNTALQNKVTVFNFPQLATEVSKITCHIPQFVLAIQFEFLRLIQFFKVYPLKGVSAKPFMYLKIRTVFFSAFHIKAIVGLHEILCFI